MFTNNQEKILTVEKLATNLEMVLLHSIAREKLNTAGTDENLFRLVPVSGHGAGVLPLELVPVPRHGAQISARVPTKGYVHTGARDHARTPSLNGALCPFRLGARALKWTLFRHASALNLLTFKKFGVGASTTCNKVNTTGTDESLFGLVPVLGHGAPVLPLELVTVDPNLCPGTNERLCSDHPLLV